MDHHVQLHDRMHSRRSLATEIPGLELHRHDALDRSLLCRSLVTLLFIGAAEGGVRGQDITPLPEPPLDTLLVRARAVSRPLYLYLGPCDSAAIACMERQVWSDSALRALLDDVYIHGRVDALTDQGRRIARRYRIDLDSATRLPWHLFIAPGGSILHRTRGPEECVAGFALHLARAAGNALLADGQYYSLRHRYELGERGDDLLLKYSVAAREAHAPEAARIADEYIHALQAIRDANTTTTHGMPPPDSARRHDRR